LSVRDSLYSQGEARDEFAFVSPPPAFDVFATEGMEYFCGTVVKQGNFIERCEIQVK